MHTCSVMGTWSICSHRGTVSLVQYHRSHDTHSHGECSPPIFGSNLPKATALMAAISAGWAKWVDSQNATNSRNRQNHGTFFLPEVKCYSSSGWWCANHPFWSSSCFLRIHETKPIMINIAEYLYRSIFIIFYKNKTSNHC